MNVVKELIIIRELLGITQEELAKKIGFSFETINRWEKDKNEIEIKNINKLYNFAFENNTCLLDVLFTIQSTIP